MSNLWLLPDDYEPMEEEAEPGMMGKLRIEVRTAGTLVRSYGTFEKRFSSFIWGMEEHFSVRTEYSRPT